MHKSVPISGCSFVNIHSINPLISKCQIKVCYVSDDPNRNGTVITKAVGEELAQSLPGSPIVGFYNEYEGDFEEHNKQIDIANGEIKVIEKTFPYGFVDINAKVWFQTFLDDDSVEREYLVTEGYIWTEQYPETKRIFNSGNNQSMELDEKNLKGVWTNFDKNDLSFFIINEAIISKLCILGENVEPCFEGAQIKESFYSYGKKEYWINKFSEIQEQFSAVYRDMKATLEKLEGANFIMGNEDKILDPIVEDTPVETETTFSETEPVSKDEPIVEELVVETEPEPVKEESEEVVEETVPEIGEPPVVEDTPVSEGETINFSAKYNALKEDHEALQQKYNLLEESYNTLKADHAELVSFKENIEIKDKQEMINSFYMLSDEDKKDVIENIKTYSLDDIEAKLSVICRRKKVNFSLPEEEILGNSVTTYNVNGDAPTAPGWVEAVRNVAKEME